jgi:hypothetical protein
MRAHAIAIAGAMLASSVFAMSGPFPGGRTETTPREVAAVPVDPAAPGEHAANATCVTFVDTVAPSLVASGRGVEGTVFVRNPTGVERTVSLAVTLRSAAGRSLGTIPASLPSNVVSASAQVFGLPFSIPLSGLKSDDFPLAGWLTLRTSSKMGVDRSDVEEVATLEVKGIVNQTSDGDWPPLGLGALAAGGAVLIGGMWVARKDIGVLVQRMGSPTWSFTESWSSTMTIGGAILTSILGFAALPEQGHALSKKTYGMLSLLAAALVSLAPGVYNFFRVPTGTKTESQAAIQYQGYVLLFLAAAFLTLTGVLTQFGLLYLLFGDIARAGLVSMMTGLFFRVVTLILGILLWLHAVTSIVLAIESYSLAAGDCEERTAQEKGLQSRLRDPDLVAQMKRPLDSWPLL